MCSICGSPFLSVAPKQVIISPDLPVLLRGEKNWLWITQRRETGRATRCLVALVQLRQSRR
jgi:hypothetical protein